MTEVLRRLAHALLLTLFLSALGMGNAYAVTACGLLTPAEAASQSGAGTTFASREAAYAACASAPTHGVRGFPVSGWETEFVFQNCTVDVANKFYRANFTSTRRNPYASISPDVCGSPWSTYTGNTRQVGDYKWSTECPAGTTWSDVTHTCFSSQACLAHNAEAGFVGVGTVVGLSSTDMCVGGCAYRPVPGTPSICAGEGADKTCSADMEFSGDPCSGSAPTKTQQQAKDDASKKQQCLPNGEVCIKPDGQHCYAASTGTQFCWQPGETGEKNDSNVRQKRDAGPTAIPPSNLQLPSGDSLQQNGTPHTTTTTTTINNSTTTTTTTTTNYTTVNGTNANGGGSAPGAGEPRDGSGKPGTGSGNSASGGGSCSQPPVTSGDAILGMIATQTWKVRCAVLGSGLNSTGDIKDCSQPYSVNTADPDAVRDVQILRSLRALNCPDETPPSDSEYIGEEGSRDGLFTSTPSGDPPGSDGLDESGFGYGSTCPAIPTANVFGVTITFDEAGHFCDWFQLGGWFVVAVTGLICIRGFGSMG